MLAAHLGCFRKKKLKLNQFELKLFRNKLTLFHSLSQKEKRKTTYKKKLFRNKNFVPKRWVNPV